MGDKKSEPEKKEFQHWPERATLQRLADQLKKLRESEHLYDDQKNTD